MYKHYSDTFDFRGLMDSKTSCKPHDPQTSIDRFSRSENGATQQSCHQIIAKVMINQLNMVYLICRPPKMLNSPLGSFVTRIHSEYTEFLLDSGHGPWYSVPSPRRTALGGSGDASAYLEVHLGIGHRVKPIVILQYLDIFEGIIH